MTIMNPLKPALLIAFILVIMPQVSLYNFEKSIMASVGA